MGQFLGHTCQLLGLGLGCLVGLVQLFALLPDRFENLIELSVDGRLAIVGSSFGQLGGHGRQPCHLFLNRVLRLAHLAALMLNVLEQLLHLLVAGGNRGRFLAVGFANSALELFLLGGQFGPTGFEIGGLLAQPVVGLLPLGLPPLLPVGKLLGERAQLIEHVGEELLELAVAGADFSQRISDRVPTGDRF